MTTPTAPTRHPEPSGLPDSSWADELATYLSPRCFPATHDHLAATLIQRRAPSYLLWHLSLAPRTREFQSLQELVERLSERPQAAPPGGVEPAS
jgi:hypothetical protein